jgi:hypothetical protein
MSFLGLTFGLLLVGHVPVLAPALFAWAKSQLTPDDLYVMRFHAFSHLFAVYSVVILAQVFAVALLFDSLCDRFIRPSLRRFLRRRDRNNRRRRCAARRLSQTQEVPK